jgi:RHS repeat-associated protein
VAQNDGTTTEYFGYDGLGSVRQMLSSTGSVLFAQVFEPYGNVYASAGMDITSFGFTGEQEDASFKLVYLRSRWYATQVGRFFSIDPWNGDSSRPMSYNAWMYVYGNPVNHIDPSGMCIPDENGKCEPHIPPTVSPCSLLKGEDLLACEKIIRRIDPEAPLSLAVVKTLDYLDDCGGPYTRYFRQPRLPQSYTNDTKQYGYWYHWLSERVPGWWNSNGTSHVKIRQLIAVAFGGEMGSLLDVEEAREATAEAFARRMWTAGFYYYIGSRQVVQTMVELGVFGKDCKANEECWKSLSPTLFAGRISVRFGLGSAAYLQAGTILYHGGWRAWEYRRPWEFGNPTLDSPEPLIEALMRPIEINQGDGSGQIFYYNRPLDRSEPLVGEASDIYNVYFVITPEQLRTHCGSNSCVSP